MLMATWGFKFKDKSFVAPGLPKHGAHENVLPKLYGAIVQLSIQYKICSAVVIDDNYIFTAAHCVDDWMGHYKGFVDILDDRGNHTGVKTTVAAFYPDYDVALLKGDFRNFNYMELDPYKTPEFGQIYYACGFPSLQNRITCSKFIPRENLYFKLSGDGFILRGMSGGPVIDTRNNKVIGVNSAVSENSVIIAPALGLLGIFEIE